VSKRIALIVAACVAAAGLAVSAATASPKHGAQHSRAASGHLLVGINDEADTLYGDPTTAFAALKSLRTQVLRVNLYWGGTRFAVANKQPTDPTDPGDPNYNWTLYDRLVRYASQSGIQVLFSIVFTPKWANGGKAANVAPTDPQDLHDFAYAAAARYSGFYAPPVWQQDPNNSATALPLPKVTYWTAWNEPNNPVFLSPQYIRSGGKWVIESAVQYAKICNAVYTGVHDVLISPSMGTIKGEQVACGVTDPKGNDAPGSGRASVDPLSFLIAAHRAGMKTFDAYAHHPYANAGTEAPSFVPKGRYKRRIQLGNINVLLSQISKFYGPKHLWITEYGYQTNPPDTSIFGVSWAKQALYMKQAYTIARRNPRIDMFLWFLIRDDPHIVTGWQSGLETVGGRKKPSWSVFRSLARG
jgi:hypothetical protein